jgi:hypothetical protein
MIQDQQQATMNDLSKSALDSAQAGVEDAKRAIVMYQSHCIEPGDGVGTTECNNLAAALRDGTHCDTIQKAGIAGSPDDKEVVIKQSEGDALLQQAYTCVKIRLDTDDFLGTVTPNTSRLIPLKATGTFSQVVIEWYSQSDLQAVADDNTATGNTMVDLGLDARLPKLADWPKNRPALLRVQLLQFGDSFKLSDFNGVANESNANDASFFLVPSRVGRTTLSFSEDIRQSPTSGVLQQIACNPNFSSTSSTTRYACKVTIQLPNPIGSADGTGRHAYLRVNELYNTNTNFSVSLQDASSNPVTFSSVQPLVDATGRANDLFRRIQSRIELSNSSIPYTEATVDLTNSLCKSFLVTDKPEDFNPGNCSGN